MSDLIDRQAVIDLLKQMRKDGDMVPWEGKDVFARIRKLPTIQPEQMEGEWVPVHPLQSDDSGAYMCSKCKTGMWEIRPSSYHYCPNCGAKMKGEQDGHSIQL